MDICEPKDNNLISYGVIISQRKYLVLPSSYKLLTFLPLLHCKLQGLADSVTNTLLLGLYFLVDKVMRFCLGGAGTQTQDKTPCQTTNWGKE